LYFLYHRYQFQNLDITPDLITKVKPLSPGVNIQEAIDFFVGPGNDSSNIRLPIVDQDGHICNLVSPTMILKFLSEHLQDVPESLRNRAISTIPGVVSPSVKTCRSTDRVIDALAQMVTNHYSALGIEDAESAHRHIFSIITIKDVGHGLKVKRENFLVCFCIF
jgi:CBS-domain-containing membrane protein